MRTASSACPADKMSARDMGFRRDDARLARSFRGTYGRTIFYSRMTQKNPPAASPAIMDLLPTCNNRPLARCSRRGLGRAWQNFTSHWGSSMFNFVKWPLAAAMIMGTLAAAPSAMAIDFDHGRDGKIGHVFVIVLENEGFNKTFGPTSLAP